MAGMLAGVSEAMDSLPATVHVSFVSSIAPPSPSSLPSSPMLNTGILAHSVGASLLHCTMGAAPHRVQNPLVHSSQMFAPNVQILHLEPSGRKSRSQVVHASSFCTDGGSSTATGGA